MTAGTVIDGRYRLDQPIGHGGMGEVWAGLDLRLDREVAVKLIRFPNGDFNEDLARRFDRECRLAARLAHPGVPGVYDTGTFDRRPYLVMQLVRGVSVADLNAEHAPLPVEWAVAIAAQVCSVLVVAHGRSLVHRDLKPTNLIVEPNGAVKVLDFGLAKALGPDEGTRITHTGQTLGTPAYMAPEQITGGPSSPQTDIYGLGCTLYDMLTGRPPFTGTNQFVVMSDQVGRPPAALRDLRPELPAGLDALVGAMLEKEPRNRPSDAVVVYRALEPYLRTVAPIGTVAARPAAADSTRMYAAALTAAFPSSPAPTPPPVGGTAEVSRADPSAVLAELDRARGHAAELVGDSRYASAAAILRPVVESASRVLGGTDDEVLSVRDMYANVLFEAGEFRPAAREFRQLVRDLTARGAGAGDQVSGYRMRVARCHAMLGEPRRALNLLGELLRDVRVEYGDDDTRAMQVRREMGLLQQDSGDYGGARATLGALLADLVRLYGPDDLRAGELREVLSSLNSPALAT